MTSHHQQADYFCRAVLSTVNRNRKSKRLILTENERRLFDTEELLSSDLLTIANHCERCIESPHVRNRFNFGFFVLDQTDFHI